MKKFLARYRDFVCRDYQFDRSTLIAAITLCFVCGGLFGFVYEVIFYYFDLGEWIKRGTTFGPWIPIYGFGALAIMGGCYKIRKNPLLVFLVSALASGILELGTGMFCLYVLGIRLWDYNTEILNFGNIGGFICLRSVLFFGISGLILMWIIRPISMFLASKLNKYAFWVICFVPGALFFIDFFYHDIIHMTKLG